MTAFEREIDDRLVANGKNEELLSRADAFMKATLAARYSYNFSWLGRPIIQYPQDILAMQELLWTIQPDLVIETGIAHGGSLIFSASMLELNASCGGPHDAMVLGVDIDIRAHNRDAIEAHPLSRRIVMLQGSSIDERVVQQVKQAAAEKRRVLVCLDSNHTHDHVLAELEAYAPLTTVGSYCVVFDTIVEHVPAELSGDRPWGPGNNPATATKEYLGNHPEFEVDRRIDNKLLTSVAPGGYLKRVR
jgi:cephalosporin hydroxylase